GAGRGRAGRTERGGSGSGVNTAARRMTGQPGGVALSNYVAGRGRSRPGRTSPLSSSVGMKLAGGHRRGQGWDNRSYREVSVMKIDPRLRGKLPRVVPAVPWQGKDGRRNGWKVTIPGRRPLATPAVADGRLFLGGGFGSYDFYALDAATGQVLWQYQTEDDGPTAAVVHEDHVAFNTESCELEVL